MMRIVFKDKDLEELYQDGKNSRKYSKALVRAFSKAIQKISNFEDERGFRQIRSLRDDVYKSGKHKGHHYVRLNEQFRLFYTIEKDENGKNAVIWELTDPH
jgi:plasmid maintenance system killer protein